MSQVDNLFAGRPVINNLIPEFHLADSTKEMDVHSRLHSLYVYFDRKDSIACLLDIRFAKSLLISEPKEVHYLHLVLMKRICMAQSLRKFKLRVRKVVLIEHDVWGVHPTDQRRPSNVDTASQSGRFGTQRDC